jgi:hypothetical protein
MPESSRKQPPSPVISLSSSSLVEYVPRTQRCDGKCIDVVNPHRAPHLPFNKSKFLGCDHQSLPASISMFPQLSLGSYRDGYQPVSCYNDANGCCKSCSEVKAAQRKIGQAYNIDGYKECARKPKRKQPEPKKDQGSQKGAGSVKDEDNTPAEETKNQPSNLTVMILGFSMIFAIIGAINLMTRVR